MPDFEDDQRTPDQPPPPQAEPQDRARSQAAVETRSPDGRHASASQPPTRRRRGVVIGAVVAVVILLGGVAGTVAVLNHRADVAAQERQDTADREAAAKAAAERQAAE
jgi:hypothetical protein